MLLDAVAEWLRRVIRNHLGLSRVGSSPTGVVVQSFLLVCASPTVCYSSAAMLFFSGAKAVFSSVIGIMESQFPTGVAVSIFVVKSLLETKKLPNP